MADTTFIPGPIQLTNTTLGLLIVHSPSQISMMPTSTNPGVSMAAIEAAAAANNNNNPEVKPSYQKPIRPAPANSKKTGRKRGSGTTPPLKPPKKHRDEESEILRCKRRLDFAKLGLAFNRANPVSVARRNERERKRVKQINSTFLSLRDSLPNVYCEHKNVNKMSKVETLRGAIDYINGLQDLLTGYDDVLSTGSPDPQVQQTSQRQQSSQCQQTSHHQQSLQHQQSQQQPQQELSPVGQTDVTSTDLHDVSKLLSVQAPDCVPALTLTSPTGSTCSSVESVSSGPVSGGEYYQDTPMYNPGLLAPPATYPDHLCHTQSLDINTEDLLEFASCWFQ